MRQLKLQKAQFTAKLKTILTHEEPIEFNGSRLQLLHEDITFTQKGQVAQLKIVDPNAHNHLHLPARSSIQPLSCRPNQGTM